MIKAISQIQWRSKEFGKAFGIFCLKLISGCFWGVVLAMIFQEILGFGTFSFVFVIVAVAAAFFRLASQWSALVILGFNFVLVLLGLLLRMYILIAPGA